MKNTAHPGAPEARRPRGRPRAFDREVALDAAMQVFWRKGFEAASIADLTAAMGINPPSLYAAFGDKEELFRAALDRYIQRAESCPYADEPTARGAIERLLTFLATDLTESGHPRGCLMMMAAATASNASSKLQKMLSEKRAESREHLKARIKQGMREGDVPPGTDAGALADFYSAIITGLSQQARDGSARRSLLATVERSMLLFPAPPKDAAKKRKRREAETA